MPGFGHPRLPFGHSTDVAETVVIPVGSTVRRSARSAIAAVTWACIVSPRFVVIALPVGAPPSGVVAPGVVAVTMAVVDAVSVVPVVVPVPAPVVVAGDVDGAGDADGVEVVMSLPQPATTVVSTIAEPASAARR
jgi:hypothetical protein